MNLPAPLSRYRRAIAGWWSRRLAGHGRGAWTLIVTFAAAALAAIVYLTTADSPWDLGIPQKLADQRELTIRDTIVAGLWLGAAINLVLAAAMLALSNWWAGPRAETAPAAISKVRPRWFWVLTLLAVVAAGWLRAPRLTHSLWNDEEQAFRKFTWGEYETPKGGGDTLEFDPAGWDRALFYSVNGNNHVFHTVFAKLCHSAWRIVARPDPEDFREWVIRLEPFVCGLLTIVVMALWLRRAGHPVAGAGAAWVLALHPWVMRYAAEARGYSAMLLLILLAAGCATEALSTGRWRWWIGYGLAQCAYLLCFAGAVYLAVAMNATLMLTLILRRDKAGLWRWFTACVLGAMIFLQMMTATVLRIWNWVQSPHVDPFPMDAAFARDFWAHLTLGVPWAAPEPGRHLGLSLAQFSADSGIFGALFPWIMPALLVSGCGAAVARSREARFFLGTLALAVVLIFLHNRVFDLAFFGWYALYLVLGFAVALGFCAEWVKKRPPALAAAALVLATYAAFAGRPLANLRAHDRHPMRQAVVSARGEAPAIDARHAALLTAAAGSGANQLRTYDPRVSWIRTAADLESVIAQSRESGKPLLVYVCGPGQLRQQHPDLAALLDNPARFERAAYLPGQEEFWSFQLYRLK